MDLTLGPLALTVIIAAFMTAAPILAYRVVKRAVK
jgi:hypothetical protein